MMESIKEIPSGHTQINAVTRLRTFGESFTDILSCPGVYDRFSAGIAFFIGFEGLYMVGSSLKGSEAHLT